MGSVRCLAERAVKIAVILVHYHTPDLLASACEALAHDAAGSGIEIEWLLIDNGSTPEERRKLAALSLPYLDPGTNLGYAAAVNLGLRETESEKVVVMNPDVIVRPGCLAALGAALQEGAAAAGPRFYWDRAHHFLLPPTERRTRRSELLAVLAGHGGLWARFGRRRWRRHAHRFWQARASYPCYELSGALLALRRDAWQHVGPFDEGYHLYFEETDWLLRLAARGLEARFVPAAEAVHLHAQSTLQEPRAEAWFVASSRRFHRRRYGRPFARLLEALSASDAASAAGWWSKPQPLAQLQRHAFGLPAAGWLEISLVRAGYPAAARRLGETVEGELSAEVAAQLPATAVTVRAVNDRGKERTFGRYRTPPSLPPSGGEG